ncbi:hypothetical protein U9M48_015455 [Paspalum notatum var. saurae]|uniref:Uncharacterized protein n=1 Tax=Paspalum notatum var. saurae TaxID=547442 RepID=A0AAQ3T6L1_PASNO
MYAVRTAKMGFRWRVGDEYGMEEFGTLDEVYLEAWGEVEAVLPGCEETGAIYCFGEAEGIVVPRRNNHASTHLLRLPPASQPLVAQPAAALQGLVMQAAPSPFHCRRTRSRAVDGECPGSDAVLESGQRLRYEPVEALAALRRRPVRPALSQRVQLGVRRVEGGVGLAGGEPPRGVVGGVVGGGVDERGEEGDVLGGVGSDVLVVGDEVDICLRAGVVVGEGVHVGVVEHAVVVVDAGVLVVGAVAAHVGEGLGQAAGACRGVDVAAAEPQGPELLRDGANDDGGEEVRGRGGVLGQGGGDEVEVGIVRAVSVEAAAVAAQ